MWFLCCDRSSKFYISLPVQVILIKKKGRLYYIIMNKILSYEQRYAALPFGKIINCHQREIWLIVPLNYMTKIFLMWTWWCVHFFKVFPFIVNMIEWKRHGKKWKKNSLLRSKNKTVKTCNGWKMLQSLYNIFRLLQIDVSMVNGQFDTTNVFLI
jgi:hypothetical protein